LWLETSSLDGLFGLGKVLDALFDSGVVGHVYSSNEDSCKSSPEDGENSGAEYTKRSYSILEVVVFVCLVDSVAEFVLGLTCPGWVPEHSAVTFLKILGVGAFWKEWLLRNNVKMIRISWH
jgi:hypothetical protein